MKEFKWLNSSMLNKNSSPMKYIITLNQQELIDLMTALDCDAYRLRTMAFCVQDKEDQNALLEASKRRMELHKKILDTPEIEE